MFDLWVKLADKMINSLEIRESMSKTSVQKNKGIFE